MTAPEGRWQPATEQGGNTCFVTKACPTGRSFDLSFPVFHSTQSAHTLCYNRLTAAPWGNSPRGILPERIMELRLNEAVAVEESRTAGIRMVLLTLRMMEHWREAAGDYNSAMVLLAIVAVSAEKLTRVDLPSDQRALRDVVDDDALAACNISSVAAATGFNRETTRRYVNRLVDEGILVRTKRGSVRFVRGFVQRRATAELLGVQLEAFARTADELLRIGVLRVQG